MKEQGTGEQEVLGAGKSECQSGAFRCHELVEIRSIGCGRSGDYRESGFVLNWNFVIGHSLFKNWV